MIDCLLSLTTRFRMVSQMLACFTTVILETKVVVTGSKHPSPER